MINRGKLLDAFVYATIGVTLALALHGLRCAIIHPLFPSRLGYGSQGSLYLPGEGSIPPGGSTLDNGHTILTIPDGSENVVCYTIPKKEVVSTDFDDTLDKWLSEKAKEHALEESLLKAILIVESGGRIKARSKKGAVGLFQLMPRTAKSLGVDPKDPKQNIVGGAKYLFQLLSTHRNLTLALAAWNAGPTAVREWGGVPPFEETRHFIKKVKVAKEVLDE